MADYEQQRAAIEGHFKQYWTACPVAYDNVDVLDDGSVPDGQDFIRVSLRGLSKDRMGFGDQFVYGGTTMVQIFTSQGEGSKDSHEYASFLDDLFLIELPGYQFGEAVRGGVVPEDDTTYQQSIYTIEYQTFE